ncbi:MAG: hypothetical protein NC098_00505 [Lachnoclostridium sp.]|nr:hypothetical protein [Lachnoclostridium sp.]
MTQRNYIQIALRGNLDGSIRTLLAYPLDDTNRAWEKSLVTPAAAIKRFLNANDCYILQQSDEGNCFSYICHNPHKESDSYEMISVMVKNGCSLTGKQLLTLFTELKRRLIEDGETDEAAINDALNAAGVPDQPVELSSWINNEASAPAEKQQEAAYRTYISTTELMNIFSFPSQPDYAPYRCIIIVQATASLRPGVKMPRITTPVRHQYHIIAPEGVELSATRAYDGDRITISYTRPGFDKAVQTFTVGTPSAYTRVEGSTIRIREPKECGIRFIRRIGVTVASSKGNSINGYTIAVNDRAINTMEPFVEFTEKDLDGDNDVVIKVASNNYRPLTLTRHASELLETDHLELVLDPVEQGVTLRLDFGDGRIIEQHIMIEKNTPEYNRLHSGNFHGFRAHRLVTEDHSEVYNVDVRFSGRPVAPNFETASEQSSDDAPQQPQHVAPVFENISDQTTEDKDKIDTSVPEVATESPEEVAEDIETSEKASRRRTKWAIISAAALVILVVILVLVLPTGDKLDVTPAGETLADDEITTAVTDTTSIAATTPAAAATAAAAGVPVMMDVDINYLNNNSVWDMSKLTSPGGIALMEALAAGDIDAVAMSDYFAINGRCINSKATEAMNLMWRAKDTPTKNSVKKLMVNTAKTGTIDLNKFVDNLARRQPLATEANTLPRPTR